MDAKQLRTILYLLAITIGCSINSPAQGVENDVTQLLKLTERNFKFSEQLLNKRTNELIIIELEIKQNRIDSFYLWSKENCLACDEAREMVRNITDLWMPVSKVPESIIIPLLLYYDNEEDIPNAVWDIDQAILSNRDRLKGNVLFTRRVVILHTLPRRNSEN